MAETQSAESAELVRQVAAVEGVPSLEEVDAMIVAAHKLPPSPNRDQTIDDLLDFRAELTSVQPEQVAA